MINGNAANWRMGIKKQKIVKILLNKKQPYFLITTTPQILAN